MNGELRDDVSGLPDVTLPGAVLVTGAGGFVGRNALEVLGRHALAFPHAALDITDRDQVRSVLETDRPWAVLNCAALADVDESERHPERAWHLNVVGAEVLAQTCAELGVRLLHFSTDYVFDGSLDRRYRVDDPTSPLNHYGATKAEAEKRVLAAHPQAIVARIAWVYGRYGKGFAGNLPYSLVRREKVEAIADRHGHPTYVVDAVERSVALLALGVPGIYHVMNQGPTSWYAFASRLNERLGLPPHLVIPVSHRHLPPRTIRPIHLAFDEDPRRPGVQFPPLRPWQEAQDAWIREMILQAGVADGR